MKRTLILHCVAFMVFAVTSSVFGGVARYSVVRDTAITYQPIVGTAVPFASFDDAVSSTPIPLGFTFVYDGFPYTEARVITNGYIVLGPQATTQTLTNDPTSTTHKPVLAPLWDDLHVIEAGRVTYTTSGSPGARVFTVQYRSVRHFSAAASDTGLNFQVRLLEGTNQIQFVYGSMVTAATLSYGLAINDPLGGVNHYLMQTVANSDIFSSTAANTALSVIPTSNSRYTFTSPTPISSDLIVTPSTGAYPTVKAAMDTLRNYGVSGSLSVRIAGTTTEPAAANDWDFIPGTHPAVGGFTVTLKLDTTVGAATVTGNFAGDAVRLRGMRNFVIDGDDPTTPGTQRGLTINNTNVAAAARTIVLIEGTQGVTIKNCVLTSNALNGTATTFGVVAILTANISTSTTTRGVYGANNFNIIENNDIRDGATNRPTNCILLSGTTTAGLRNVGNIIRLNDIRNYGGSTATRGIRIEANDSLTVIDRNNIFTISTTIADVRGIMINAATVFGTQILGNKIYDQLSTSATATIQGIRIFSATTPPAILVANNFISIDAPAGLTTGTVGGIDQSTGLVNVVFNSVRIGGTVTAGTTGTTACYRRIASSTGTIYNNIFFNAATNSGGTATHWAIASGANTGLVSNHNDLFVNGVGGVLGTTDGTTAGNRLTLFDWQNATGQDLNSISALPPFVSATDLHIPNGTATALESGGISAAGVASDIDGDTRATYSASPLSGPNSAPDIGADEFNGILADATPPNIIYTTLPNTPLTTNRTLSARIRDAASGVQRSAAGAPRLWFRKNSGPYVQTTGVEAAGDTFAFTFDHSLVGGVVAGDTIYYYVAAQDSAGIVGTVPAGSGGTINPPNATVPNPNSYRILQTLSGTFNVGTAQPYANLGAIFSFINGNAVGGNITINITSDITEPATATLNEVFYVGGPWTITIRPSGGDRTDTANIVGAMIDLNGADNVIIGDPGARLTLRNASATFNETTITLRNDATNNTITNCTLEGAGTSTTTSGVVLFGLGVSTGNDGNTISNCDIRDLATTGARPWVGVLSLASSDPASNSGNTIINNNIYNFTFAGVNVLTPGGGNWTISNNHFYYNNATLPTSAQTSINFNPGLTANDNLIYGNYVGGQAPFAGGAAWTNGANAQFAGIIATVGTTSASVVRKNTVKNMVKAGTGVGGVFPIAIINGAAIVDSNTVGDPTLAARAIAAVGVPPSPDVRRSVERTMLTADGMPMDVQADEVLARSDPELWEATAQRSEGHAPNPEVLLVPNSIVNAGTGVTTGISHSSTSNIVIAYNEISNMTATAAGNTGVRGIGNGGGSGSVTTIVGNVIHDLTSFSTTTSLTAPPVAGIVWFPTDFTGVGSVTANTIYALKAADSSAVATNAMGIMLTNCAATVTRNLVHDIRNASTGVTVTAPPTATGIYVRFTAGALVANNMASVGSGQTTNTVFAGIWNGAGTINNYEMHYNSTLVSGTASGGALNSFAFIRGNHTGTAITTLITARNNIFVNVRGGGTGKHYAIANQNSATDTTGWGPGRFDYNIFNTNDPGTVGLWGPTDQTFPAWQVATGGDANTLVGDPGYVSATNLHINPVFGLPSNNAFPLVGVVNDDFDGQVRSTTTPDRGADEYTLIPVPPPVITSVTRSTRVPNAGDTVGVTATIRDTLGISSASIIYSINGAPQAPVPMTMISGTPDSGTWVGTIPGSASENGYRINIQIRANSVTGAFTITPITAANSYYAGISPLSLTGLRRLNANGHLIDSAYYARVTGTVNGPNFQTTNLGYHFQDAVGGIQLFSFGISIPPLNLGDSIIVTGRVIQFNGLTEIVPDNQTTDVQVVATGRTVTPIDVSVATFNSNPELYESRLVRINALDRVRPTPAWPSLGQSVNITMYQLIVADSIVMRIDSDTELDGTPEPAWPKKVTGVITQFDATAPRTSGYQTQPRYVTDFTAPTPQPYVFTRSPQKPITDLNYTYDTINVPISLTIGRLQVLIDSITHTWDADLDVFLFSPSGDSIELFTDVGSSGDNFIGTLLTDTAAISITAGTAPFTGAFRPEASVPPAMSFAYFNGSNALGNWVLRIYDDASGDIGTLHRWSLIFDELSIHDIGVANVEDSPGSIEASVQSGELSRTMNAHPEKYAGIRVVTQPGVFQLGGDAPFTLNAIVQNYGTFVENTYQVGWAIDGIAQTPVGNTQPLEIGDIDTLVLTWSSPTPGVHTARAWTILAGDTNPANDTSGIWTFTILPTNVIFAEGFNTTTMPPYPAGWHVKDLDGGGSTPHWFQGNPAVFPAFERSGYIGSNYQRANNRYIDEWLVTPNFGVTAPAAITYVDSLTFWQRSPGGLPHYPDSIMILVSSTDTAVASFTPINYFKVDTVGWRRKAFALPYGTRYVAFRYLHYDGGPTGNNSNYIGLDDIRVTRYNTTFFDGFEAYNAGQQLVVQNPVDWITWSGPPGTAEDPFVSNVRAFDGVNSVVIVQNNDLVHLITDDTTRTYRISFRAYIPSSKAGYFNTLNNWPATIANHWAMEAYFDSGSTGNNGRLNAGALTNIPFSYPHNTWMLVELRVDLRGDSAQFLINQGLVHSWKWTRAASGTRPKRLRANDFYGATAWDQMYVDNYYVAFDSSITGVEDRPIIPTVFALEQNYPNPFNPTTTIRYSLPREAFVSLKVYNVLGQEVAQLVHGEQRPGHVTVVWDGRNRAGNNVSSGMYFYRIEATPTDGSGAFVQVKKMMLVK